MLHVSPSTITSPANVACSTSWFLSASIVLSCFVCLLFSSQSLWRGERKKTVTTTKAYLVFSMGQTGNDPIGLWSTACIISGIRWTGLDPSYPYVSSLSVKLQKFSITPKSTEVLKNLSINFIWIGLWGPNVFTLGVGRKKSITLLCFLWRNVLSVYAFLLYENSLSSPSLLFCIKNPIFSCHRGKSDTGKCFHWFQLRPLDPTFWNAAKWLFWRGLKMEITFFAFQEWSAKDFPSELICFRVLCNALFCLVLGQTALWWHKHVLVSDLKGLVKWRDLSFLVGVWVWFFFFFSFSLAWKHVSIIHKALKIFIVT